MAPRRQTQAIPRIDGSFGILDLLTIFPKAADILTAYGLACFSCAFAGSETLAEGCEAHGFSGEMTAELLDDLNRALAVVPLRPASLSMTPRAVKAAHALREKEKLRGNGLKILLDGQGSFCMEFRTKPERGDRVIAGKGRQSFPLFVSPLLLLRVGGATIDYRKGAFQLDLLEDGERA